MTILICNQSLECIRLQIFSKRKKTNKQTKTKQNKTKNKQNKTKQNKKQTKTKTNKQTNKQK